MSQLSRSDALSVGFVAILISMLAALPFTIIVTLAVIRSFQKRVAVSMRTAASGSETPEFVERLPSGAALRELKIKKIDVMSHQLQATPRASLVLAAQQRERKLAAIFSIAACAHPLILAGIMTLNGYKPHAQNPLVPLMRLYCYFFVIAATPVALAATMILTKQLRFYVFAVLALIALLLGLGWTIRGSDPLGLWLMIAGLPTGMVLLLNARRVRAVGPIVLTATLLLFSAIAAGNFYLALFTWDFIGPVHFVREDLAQLPFLTALRKYLENSPSISLAIETLVAHPLRIIRAEHAERLSRGYKVLYLASSLSTILVGAAFAWGLVRWLATQYKDRRASDQMLTIDVLMAIFTITAFLFFYSAFGVATAIYTLAGFFGYKLLARFQLRNGIGLAPPEKAFTLLLLRVFRAKRRGQPLLEKIMHRWRYIGPVRLIAGTDFVDSFIEPHEFFEFLSRRLSRAFVRDREDLEHRLSELIPKPDLDGLYRIEDFFCHLDTWQMTVAYLAKQADVVLMDLRGFNSAHRGCAFEIQMLLDSFPVDQIVFAVDNSTDHAYLEKIFRLTLSMSALPKGNAGLDQISLVQAAGESRTVDRLLCLLCEKAELSHTA